MEPFFDKTDSLLKDIRRGSWMEGPGKLLSYRMKDCNTALGAALGTVDAAVRAIARELAG